MLTLLTSKAFELIVFLLQTLTPPVPALWTIARKKLPNFIFFGLPSRNTACDLKALLVSAMEILYCSYILHKYGVRFYLIIFVRNNVGIRKARGKKTTAG